MRSLTYTLFTAALLMGCRDSGTPVNSDDLTSAVSDMSTASGDLPPATATTIRELNNLKFPDNTVVRTSGVVISPYLWVDTFAASGTSPASCRFNLFIAQPDAAPTIKDGLRVARSISVFLDGGTPNVATCRTEAGKDAAITAMTALKPGDAVDVSGRFNISGTQQRSIAILGADGIVGKGPAPMPIQPAPVTAAMLTEGTAAAYRDAQGMLVQLRMATVTDSGVPVPAAFKVTTEGNAAKTAINTQYITSGPALDGGTFTAPANGAVLKSVTGIVFPEGMGSVRPRSPAEVER